MSRPGVGDWLGEAHRREILSSITAVRAAMADAASWILIKEDQSACLGGQQYRCFLPVLRESIHCKRYQNAPRS